MATAEPLRGKRFGVPAGFWAGLDRDVENVMKAARQKLEGAGAVFVEADIAGLFEQNAKVSFPVALHEPIADIPAYLKASEIEGITLADIAAKIASPDVKGAFGAITADAFGAAYQDAITVQRPALQKMYEDYFRDNNLDAILFPTTVAPAPLIDAVKGSGEMSINGGAPVPTFDTMIRNTDPGSNAGIPGLSLFAGMTPGGLPVGLEIDGPVGSDAKLLGLGTFDRSDIGFGAAAEDLSSSSFRGASANRLRKCRLASEPESITTIGRMDSGPASKSASASRNDEVDASDVVVIDHDLVRHRPRLAGQDKPRLELPRLQRIIHFHARVALDQLGAAGRAHAALAGERQIHARAQRGIQNRFVLGHRHVAALAVDDQ